MSTVKVRYNEYPPTSPTPRAASHQSPPGLDSSALLAFFQQPHQLLNAPFVVAESCRHRWRHAQRLVTTAEVVVDEVQRACWSPGFLDRSEQP